MVEKVGGLRILLIFMVFMSWAPATPLLSLSVFYSLVFLSGSAASGGESGAGAHEQDQRLCVRDGEWSNSFVN